jgi:hypothetical protein
MRLGRAGIVSLTLIVLVGLFGWQWTRERKIATCIEADGQWDGVRSICIPLRGGPIIMRDLRRS